MFDLYSWNTSIRSEVRIAEWLVHGSANAKSVGLIPHCVRFFLLETFCSKFFCVIKHCLQAVLPTTIKSDI